MPDRSIRIVLLKADAALERRVEADLLDYRDAAFRLSSVDSLDDAFAQVRDASCDVLLLGPEAARAGPEVLRQVMTQAPGLPVVVLTHHDRSYAIAAVRAGAQDCLQDEEIGGGALGHALHFACERARTAAASVAAERAPDLDAGRLAAILVHDLHEPLRVVVEYGRLLELRMQDSLDPSTGQYLRRLRDAGDRMQQILGSLLDYARAGTREPERHPIEVEEILKSALAGVSPGAAVRWDRLPELSVDGVQLVQVFQNLISNAIKFHGEGEPEIEVGASLEGDHWVLWVSDNGPGVAPEEAQHIFEVFHRAGRSSHLPGSGIGLAICRRIIEGHGGRIWVEPSPSGGACFRFSLPPGSGIGLAICRRIIEGHGGRIWVEPSPSGGACFRFSLPAA
jgi:signal transduction histidine kinase